MRQVGTLQFQLGAVVEDESHLNLDKGLSLVSPALEEVVPLYVQMVSVHFWVELTSHFNSPCRDSGRDKGEQVGRTSHAFTAQLTLFFHVTIKGIDGPRSEAL